MDMHAYTALNAFLFVSTSHHLMDGLSYRRTQRTHPSMKLLFSPPGALLGILLAASEGRNW